MEIRPTTKINQELKNIDNRIKSNSAYFDVNYYL
ncbi:MAG: hypothetical protein ACJAVD_001017 [Porticoccaceae bacterium]|jgi:hypothetical protein